jgi:arginine-tRNA-protein transferase
MRKPATLSHQDFVSGYNMESLLQYLAPVSTCGYLPDQLWRLEFEHFADISKTEYMERMEKGWRRFGRALFRPRCNICTACRPLRIVVDKFQANRSQRRACKANEGVIEVKIGKPSVSRSKLRLYDWYHAFQAEAKGWPSHSEKDAAEYTGSFVDNPFPTQEWCYFLDGRLIAVGYVDELPRGLSAIYFFYDPAQRNRSIGTWNVVRIIEQAAARRIPHVYLGYYVERCPSMTYKAHFVPNELLGLDGAWHPFKS